MQTQQEMTQTRTNTKQWIHRALPITGLLVVAGIAFGALSQSAMAAAPSAMALAATKTPKPTTAVVAAKVVTPTAVPTDTAMMMGSADYLSGAQVVYSDTARVINSLAKTLSVSGTLNVKAIQGSLTDMSTISANAQKLAAAPGDYKDVGKKLALLAKRIDAANTTVAAELKQASPDVAKIKKALSPVASEADSLNSTLHKAMMAMGAMEATPTVSATKTAAMGKLPAGAVAPTDAFTCPADHAIKGNKQSHIYHMPTSKTYKETKPEACFATPADAEAAGYRAEKK